jgi:uncharacterized iron-regulated membrane protein
VRWRNWLFRVHLWLGLTVGPLVGIVALSGAVVVFRYELNRATTPGTAYVTPHAERLSIDEITEKVRANRPADRIQQAAWEAGPDTAWNYRATSPEGHRIHTFVNQYTGEVTGVDDYHRKVMQIIFDLHAYLLGGSTGEFLNGFVALGAVLLGMTGLIIWWPGLGHWQFGFRWLAGARWQRQNYDLHKLVGFYSSLAMIFVSFTGAYYSFPALYKSAAAKITGTPVMTEGPRAATLWKDREVPMEEFLRAAERVQPGTRAISFSFPQNAGDPVTVRTKEARDWHRIGLNYVYLEPASARVIRSARFADANVATKAILFMYPFHFGRFGGRWGTFWFYFVMAVYIFIGLAPFALMVTGLLMYWNRSLSKKLRRHRQTAAPLAVPKIL